MKKLTLLLCLFVSLIASAQKGVNIVVVAADIDLPTGDFGDAFSFGAGPLGKILFGVTDAGSITATTGISFYSIKSNSDIPSDAKISFHVVPILAGYRQNFNGVFIEPQIGMGVYGSTVKYQGQSESSSETAFTWAAGLGYSKNNIEVALRYQSSEKEGESLSEIGLHIGYIIPLRKK